MEFRVGVKALTDDLCIQQGNGGWIKWTNFIWLWKAAAQQAWRRLKHRQDQCQVLSSAIVL